MKFTLSWLKHHLDTDASVADIAYALTTYEVSDDPTARFSSIAGVAGVELLAEAGQPLTLVHYDVEVFGDPLGPR